MAYWIVYLSTIHLIQPCLAVEALRVEVKPFFVGVGADGREWLSSTLEAPLVVAMVSSNVAERGLELTEKASCWSDIIVTAQSGASTNNRVGGRRETKLGE